MRREDSLSDDVRAVLFTSPRHDVFLGVHDTGVDEIIDRVHRQQISAKQTHRSLQINFRALCDKTACVEAII